MDWLVLVAERMVSTLLMLSKSRTCLGLRDQVCAALRTNKPFEVRNFQLTLTVSIAANGKGVL